MVSPRRLCDTALAPVADDRVLAVGLGRWDPDAVEGAGRPQGRTSMTTSARLRRGARGSRFGVGPESVPT